MVENEDKIVKVVELQVPMPAFGKPLPTTNNLDSGFAFSLINRSQ